MTTKMLSRRQFLQRSAMVGAGTLLASCARGSEQAPAVSDEEAPANAPEAEAGVVEFTIWGSWDATYGLLMDEFHKTSDTKVTISSAPYAQYHDQLLTRFASGDFPDVAMIVDFDFARFQNRGFLMDLTPLSLIFSNHKVNLLPFRQLKRFNGFLICTWFTNLGQRT